MSNYHRREWRYAIVSRSYIGTWSSPKRGHCTTQVEARSSIARIASTKAADVIVWGGRVKKPVEIDSVKSAALAASIARKNRNEEVNSDKWLKYAKDIEDVKPGELRTKNA